MITKKNHKYHDKYSNYHFCIVKECKNTTIKTPDKLWIRMPTEINLRNSWLKAANRDPLTISKDNQNNFFCEDHFDLEKDMENYMQYKLMGSVKRIRMKKDCIPSRFECQSKIKRKHGETADELQHPSKKRALMPIILENNKQDSRINVSTSSFSQESLNKEQHLLPSSSHQISVTIETVYIKEEPKSDNEEEIKLKEEPEWESPNSDDSDSQYAQAGLCETELVLGTEPLRLPDWTSPPEDVKPCLVAPAPASSRTRNGQKNAVKNGSRKLDLIVNDMHKRISKKQSSSPASAPSKTSTTATEKEKDIKHKKKKTCKICNKQVTALKTHTLIHTGVKPYSCDVCDKKFTDWSNLSSHKRVHSDEKPYACETCEMKFRRPSDLKKHARTHTGVKLYACELCEKKYTQPKNLKIHKLAHAGVKPYSCELCKKDFITLYNLKKHQQLHSGTGVKSYTCEICQKSFTELFNFKRHKRIHTGVKPFSCDICEKEFREFNTLKLHKRIHTGEKPYSCGICGKKFRKSNHLQRHERIHTGHKPYSCDLCEMKFTDVSNLKKHTLIHSGIKPYICDMCDMKFTQLGNLKRHINHSHS